MKNAPLKSPLCKRLCFFLFFLVFSFTLFLCHLYHYLFLCHLYHYLFLCLLFLSLTPVSVSVSFYLTVNIISCPFPSLPLSPSLQSLSNQSSLFSKPSVLFLPACIPTPRFYSCLINHTYISKYEKVSNVRQKSSMT